LGPYATYHSNFTSSIKPQASTSRIAAIKSKLDDILSKHHVIVLSREALLEKVQWIEPGIPSLVNTLRSGTASSVSINYTVNGHKLKLVRAKHSPGKPASWVKTNR